MSGVFKVMDCPVSNSKGFGLVEVLLAATMLSVIGALLLRAGVSAHSITPHQMDRTGGANIARTQIEVFYESVRQDWWDPVANPTRPLTPTAGYVVDTADATTGVSYTPRHRVSAVTLTGDTGGNVAPDYRRVDVKVACANCG